MTHNPFTRAKEYKPYVAAFLAEVSTGKPDKFRIIPSRYLCHLYNLWCEQRGGFEDQKMNQQRFSFVLSSLGYEKTRKTRSGITCFNVCLLAEPTPPMSSTRDSLGARCMEPFNCPPISEIPATILNEVTAVRHIADLMAREEQAELERFTDEERTRPAHMVLNDAFKKPEPSDTQADAGEPDFEQVEANDAKADAESLTETNDYDA